jgi:hypothetical protein
VINWILNREPTPDKPQDNYKRIDQVNSETGKLWGAEDRMEDFNEYVNGEGHSFLQYMNGIQYADTPPFGKRKKEKTEKD